MTRLRVIRICTGVTDQIGNLKWMAEHISPYTPSGTYGGPRGLWHMYMTIALTM